MNSNAEWRSNITVAPRQVHVLSSQCHHPFRGNIISLCFSTHSLKARTWGAQSSDLVGCSW